LHNRLVAFGAGGLREHGRFWAPFALMSFFVWSFASRVCNLHNRLEGTSHTGIGPPV
jgi:hypothetical protein